MTEVLLRCASFAVLAVGGFWAGTVAERAICVSLVLLHVALTMPRKGT